MDLPEPFRRRLGDAEGLPVTEREQLLAALVATQWNKSQAAQQLHWSRMTLYRKLRQYHLTVPRSVRHSVQRHTVEDRNRECPRSARAAAGDDDRDRWSSALAVLGVAGALWQRMASVIPPRKSQAGHPRTVDLRRITEGIFYVLRTGTPWHACPRARFGPPSTVYYYFVQWVNAGVFAAFWAEALTLYDDLQGLSGPGSAGFA